MTLPRLMGLLSLVEKPCLTYLLTEGMGETQSRVQVFI